ALIVAMHRLLHRYRCADCVHRTLEHHHQPIAEVLDLLPAALAHGVTEQAEMRPPDPLRGIVANLAQQLRRAHEISEQERHGPPAACAGRPFVHPFLASVASVAPLRNPAYCSPPKPEKGAEPHTTHREEDAA